MLAGVGIVSAIRVVGAVWSGEVFGAEATLALATLVLVPCLVGRTVAARRRQRRRSSGDGSA